jgi:serine phosphatase RsbU (regulator of sigma subunit)
MLLLVDVMGHGPPAAATVTMLLNRYLPDADWQDRQPAELLTELHDQLQTECAATGQFVAALALLVDRQGGTVTGSNAGVPEPQLGQPGSAWQTWSLPRGVLLGLPLFVVPFQEASAPLLAAEYLLAFTDGVSEAGRGKSSLFQSGPLQSFLATLPAGLVPRQVVHELLRALQAHVGTGWSEDDTTILCLRRL